MILYDVLSDGFHTPLSREEIRELFHTGRINLQDPCKLSVFSAWRTVDELFPLLKYDGVDAFSGVLRREDRAPFASRVTAFVAGTLAFLVAAAALTFALLSGGAYLVTFTPRSSHSSVDSAPIPMAPIAASSPVTRPSVPSPRLVSTNNNYAGAVSSPGPESIRNYQAERARVERERFAREQLQRDQAVLADRLRNQNQAQAAASAASAGRDEIVPFDKYVMLELGGSVISVKIHDNDVTSFDAWINGAHFRDVRKQKGITGSRADETLIYGGGAASLYYVWEISGQLNHCRLRVRRE